MELKEIYHKKKKQNYLNFEILGCHTITGIKLNQHLVQKKKPHIFHDELGRSHHIKYDK